MAAFHGGALLRRRSNRVCITDIGKLPDDFIGVCTRRQSVVLYIGRNSGDCPVESNGPARVPVPARVFTRITLFPVRTAQRAIR